jgi:ferric iron reductase protein FhuF
VTDAFAALRAAAEFGPYFAVDLTRDSPQWIPYIRLTGDPAVLRERVSAVRAVLAHRSRLEVDAVPVRVVASLHSLALAARLVAPPLAAAVLASVVPELTVAAIGWQPTDGGPVPMVFEPVGATVAAGPDELAVALHDAVVVTAVEPLVRAFHEVFRMSPKVLWGNVSSAIAGAATMLATARPELGDRAVAIAGRLVRHGVLAGYGDYVRPWPGEAHRFFVRDNCCLFYRIPGGGICGDCVLVSDVDRRAGWRRAVDLGPDPGPEPGLDLG